MLNTQDRTSSPARRSVTGTGNVQAFKHLSALAQQIQLWELPTRFCSLPCIAKPRTSGQDNAVLQQLSVPCSVKCCARYQPSVASVPAPRWHHLHTFLLVAVMVRISRRQSVLLRGPKTKNFIEVTIADGIFLLTSSKSSTCGRLASWPVRILCKLAMLLDRKIWSCEASTAVVGRQPGISWQFGNLQRTKGKSAVVFLIASLLFYYILLLQNAGEVENLGRPRIHGLSTHAFQSSKCPHPLIRCGLSVQNFFEVQRVHRVRRRQELSVHSTVGPSQNTSRSGSCWLR